MSINYVEIGTYCQENYKESFNGEKWMKYSNTWFVAIDKDDNVNVSITPHILEDATKCILIHEYRKLAETNWYKWYNIEFINEKGEVLRNRIDDEFTLYVNYIKSWNNQVMHLEADNNIYYKCKAPWDKGIKKVWQLYCNLKEVKAKKERELVSSLFQKNESILEMQKSIDNFNYTNHFLEQERDLYKSLLDEIKGIVNKE